MKKLQYIDDFKFSASGGLAVYCLSCVFYVTGAGLSNLVVYIIDCIN